MIKKKSGAPNVRSIGLQIIYRGLFHEEKQESSEKRKKKRICG
jgi:hypothetical protein